jgi:hypothetical protein
MKKVRVKLEAGISRVSCEGSLNASAAARRLPEVLRAAAVMAVLMPAIFALQKSMNL